MIGRERPLALVERLIAANTARAQNSSPIT